MKALTAVVPYDLQLKFVTYFVFEVLRYSCLCTAKLCTVGKSVQNCPFVSNLMISIDG